MIYIQNYIQLNLQIKLQFRKIYIKLYVTIKNITTIVKEYLFCTFWFYQFQSEVVFYFSLLYLKVVS